MAGAGNQSLDVMARSAAITDPAANIWNKEAAEVVGGKQVSG
jgi:hypothetical protein